MGQRSLPIDAREIAEHLAFAGKASPDLRAQHKMKTRLVENQNPRARLAGFLGENQQFSGVVREVFQNSRNAARRQRQHHHSWHDGQAQTSTGRHNPARLLDNAARKRPQESPGFGAGTSSRGRIRAWYVCTSTKPFSQRKGNGTLRSTTDSELRLNSIAFAPTESSTVSPSRIRASAAAQRGVEIDIGRTASLKRAIQSIGKKIDAGIRAAAGREGLEAQHVVAARDDGVGEA